MKPFDCVVIGGGPAGLTAAVYLQRFQRRLLVVDGGNGRALKITKSHNCPGFPDGISGKELVGRLGEQLRAFDGEVVAGEVTNVVPHDDGLLKMELLSGMALVSRTVLLCTGVQDRLPALPGVDQVCLADRLRQCPICDGYEYRGRAIGVLGSSDHAVREAKFLEDFGASVLVLPLEGQGQKNFATRVAFDGESVQVTMSDGSTQRCDVLYAALGVEPRTSLARQLGATLDDSGNVVVDAHCRSSIRGLYAAGDVVSALDQIAVAFGHGAIAATTIHNDLRVGVPPV